MKLQVSFRLREPLSRAHNVDPKDVLRTKAALRALGFYEPDEAGLTPIPDSDLFRGIEAFQRKNKLHIDGEVQPDGPTEKLLQESLAKAPVGGRRGSAGQRDRILVAAKDEGEGRERQERQREGAGDSNEQNDRDPRDNQEAIVVVLPPLAYWLAGLLGVSAAIAWKWWQSLSKEQQQSLLARHGNPDKDDEENAEKCYQRWMREQDRCREEYPSKTRECIDRANHRMRRCYREGFPEPLDLDEWSDRDF